MNFKPGDLVEAVPVATLSWTQGVKVGDRGVVTSEVFTYTDRFERKWPSCEVYFPRTPVKGSVKTIGLRKIDGPPLDEVVTRETEHVA